MAITKSGGRKNDLDKIYTSDSNAEYCLQEISKIHDLNKFETIVEPSAGGGSFLRAMEKMNIPTKKIKAYDVEPENENIEKMDWFNVSIDQSFGDTLVVGNPPYGQQNKLAVEFMNHAASFENVSIIGFVLPLSFKKESVQNRVHANFGNAHNIELPNTEFTLLGEKYKVPTFFQIWERLDEPRKKIMTGKTKTNLFSIVKTPQEADLRIQRVGGSAGKASLDMNRSSASNYWIKLNGNIKPNDVLEFVKFVNKLKFPTVEFTVGPKSLPLAEMIKTIEENWINF